VRRQNNNKAIQNNIYPETSTQTMKTITFTCETITPMFLSGADGQTPELRPPSIKGAMRFWWRAMNGHLGLRELKEKESKLFGGTEGSGRSKIIVRAQTIKRETKTEVLVPHKTFMKQEAFTGASTFKVILSLSRETKEFNLNHLCSLFVLTVTLGGFGKRIRRGMGSLNIVKVESDDTLIAKTKQPLDIYGIVSHLNVISPYFIIRDEHIFNSYSGITEKYALIKKIEIGTASDTSEALLYKISKKTSFYHSEAPQEYDATLGNARGGRFASPVFVSLIKGMPNPIVTTLKTAPPPKIAGNFNSFLQEDFINSILE